MIPPNGSSSELDSEMTLLAVLADSVPEVIKLEILKFDVIAMIVLGDLCSLLVVRLKQH